MCFYRGLLLLDLTAVSVSSTMRSNKETELALKLAENFIGGTKKIMVMKN